MTKSITKTTGRKRPKSVLQKAWETRRKNAKHRVSLEGQMNRAIFGDNADTSNLTKAGLASLAKGIPPTSETAIPRSEVDAIARTIDMQREDLLCAFVADMAMQPVTNFHPIIVSKPIADAIESYLRDQGFSPWGRQESGEANSPVAKAA